MKQIVYVAKRFDPNTLPIKPSKNVPGIFYHGVTLSGEYGWYAALNILERIPINHRLIVPIKNFVYNFDTYSQIGS